MIDKKRIETAAQEIAKRFQGEKNVADSEIEAFLLSEFEDCSMDERIEVMDSIIDLIKIDDSKNIYGSTIDDEMFADVCSFLLGRDVASDDLSTSEKLEKLKDSLDTIFSALNQLISVINMTFSGRRSQDQTIRQVIGFHMKGDDKTKSLESYLGQINDAFLTTQQSFKGAALHTVQLMLSALDPETLSSESGKSLKFGPLRKAELFDVYTHKFEKISRWFKSGKFMEDYLRQFEKISQEKIDKKRSLN